MLQFMKGTTFIEENQGCLQKCFHFVCRCDLITHEQYSRFKVTSKSYIMTSRRRQIHGSLASCLQGCVFENVITKAMGVSWNCLPQLGWCNLILCSKSCKTLGEFTWQSLIAEVKRIALTLFHCCTKTREPKCYHWTLVSLVCKQIRPTSSQLQRLTFVFYFGCVFMCKRVRNFSQIVLHLTVCVIVALNFDCLQKICLCLSYPRTIKLDQLGEVFDQKVHSGRESSMETTVSAWS